MLWLDVEQSEREAEDRLAAEAKGAQLPKQQACVVHWMAGFISSPSDDSDETLPDDVVVEILVRVTDVAALFRCAATCKRCGLLVAEPSFLCRRWPEGVSRPSSLLGFFSVQQPREEPTEGSSTATPISPYTPAPWSLPPRTGQPLPQFSWSSRHPGRAAHLAPRPSCWAQGPTGRTRQWTHEDHDPGIVRSNRR